MEVHVNGVSKIISTPINLKEFFEKLSIPVAYGVAVCVNDEIVSQSHWGTTILKEQDQIEVIQATQGG